MSEITANIEGVEALMAKLNKLGDDAPRIIGKANRAGAKVLLAAAQAKAPVLSGLLRSNLRIRISNKKTQGRYRAFVGIGVKDWTGPSFYGSFVLWGHRAGPRRLGNRRKEVAGNDFLKKSAEQSYQAATDAVIDALKTGIEAAAGGAK